MQYRTDPRSGNTLSVLGFGCMRFPSSALGRIDMKAAEALVLDAVEQGVNYFDTAYLYRGNEEAVGAILEEHNLRDRIFLAWPPSCPMRTARRTRTSTGTSTSRRSACAPTASTTTLYTTS